MYHFAIALLVATSAGGAAAQGGSRPVADAFQGMSPEGRRLMTEAHLGALDQASRDALASARERTLSILDADPLDGNALKAALDAEANLVRAGADAQRDRMYAAYTKLSPADRKAYVAASRKGARPR